jgi:hypothetical protein
MSEGERRHKPGRRMRPSIVYDPNGGLRVYQPQTGAVVTTLDCGGGHRNTPILVDKMIAMPDGNSNSHATGGTLNTFRLP